MAVEKKNGPKKYENCFSAPRIRTSVGGVTCSGCLNVQPQGRHSLICGFLRPGGCEKLSRRGPSMIFTIFHDDFHDFSRASEIEPSTDKGPYFIYLNSTEMLSESLIISIVVTYLIYTPCRCWKIKNGHKKYKN